MKISNKTVNVIWGILLFSILAFPRIFQFVKIFLCLLLIAANLVTRRGITLWKPVVCFTVLWMVYSALAIAFGILYGNPAAGIYAFFRVNVVNVLLFFALMVSICREEAYEATFKAILCATLFIAVYNLTFIACGFLGTSIPFLEKLDATARLQFHEGYSHVVTTNLSMTILLFPLLVMLINESGTHAIVGKRALIGTTVLCAAAMVLSGRRILWLCLVLGVFALFFINTRRIEDQMKLLVIGVLVLVAGILFAEKTGMLSISGLIARFKDAFASIDQNGTENERLVQGKYLIEWFKKEPFFGNGAGAVIPGFARSTKEPWNFELSYHEMLFQSGLIGAFFYFLSLAVIFVESIQAAQVDRLVGSAILVAYVCVLGANGTNPYYSSSFDFMIFLFLPFMLAELVQGRENSIRNETVFEGARPLQGAIPVRQAYIEKQQKGI